MLDISVVVPTYNPGEELLRCLEALSEQTVTTDRYEVIVVDDGSPEDIAAGIERFGVKLLRQDHAGPAAARNYGAQCSQGELLLFTDSDCVPQKDWVQEMIRPFQDPEVVGVKGAYRTRQRGLVPRFAQAEFDEKYEKMRKASSIDFVDTYSAGYRRTIFLDNGGFDPSFPGPSAEDVEFSFRLSQKGYKMVFAPKAIVYHTHPSSLWRYLSRKFRFGLWRAKVYARFPGKMGKDSYTPRAVPLQILSSAALAISLVFAVFQPLVLWASLFLAAAFFSSILPLCARTFSRDKAVALASPPLLFLRCLAQFLGLLTGAVAFSRGGQARERVLGGLLAERTDTREH